jgi:hypothetical protein
MIEFFGNLVLYIFVIAAISLAAMVGVIILSELGFRVHKNYLNRRFLADLDKIDREFEKKKNNV